MYQALVVVQYISIFFLIIETMYIFSKWSNRQQTYLLLSCIAILINNVGYLLEMTATTYEGALFAKKVVYLGKVWVAYALLVFVFVLCKEKVNKKFFFGLGIVHLVTFFVVLTTEYTGLYYDNMRFVDSGMFPHLESDKGPWHIGYTILIVGYMIYGLVILIRGVIKEKNKKSKTRLIFILVAVGIESVGYTISLSGIAGCYDTTVLGYTIAMIFMYIAIFKTDLLDSLQLAKDYVVDEVTEGIIVIDIEGEITYFNKQISEIFPDIKNNQEQVIEMIKDSLDNKKPLTLGDRIYTTIEKEIVEDDKVAANVIVIIDDTAHFKYTEELEKQKEIAEEANHSKSRFLSVVSHEIRTPMNAVVGMADLMLNDKDKLNDKQVEYLSCIKTSGDSLVMIVNDILDQSKIEAGKMEIINEPYDIRGVVNDVKMIIRNRIGEKPIRLESVIDDKIPLYLDGDALRIRQVLINLMNNAVKFTEEGFIRLVISSVEEESNRRKIKFEIIDSGQGIKKEDLAKLGEAFTQVDTKKNHNKEGTGLGLSISRDFISLMGGKLDVSSKYGKGTTFFFSIWQGEVERSQSIETGSKNFKVKDVRILIVDDTSVNLMVATEMLEPLGIEVDAVTSSERALRIAKKKQYDLIFTDYMMPGMDGLELTQRIRELSVVAAYDGNHDLEKYYKTVPIVALSADVSSDSKDVFVAAGMNDSLAKPLEMESLKDMLVKWLSEDKFE